MYLYGTGNYPNLKRKEIRSSDDHTWTWTEFRERMSYWWRWRVKIPIAFVEMWRTKKSREYFVVVWHKFLFTFCFFFNMNWMNLFVTFKMAQESWCNCLVRCRYMAIPDQWLPILLNCPCRFCNVMYAI